MEDRQWTTEGVVVPHHTYAALGWTILCAIAAIVANGAIVWWRTGNHSRRIDQLEKFMSESAVDRSAIRTTLVAHEKRLDHLEDA